MRRINCTPRVVWIRTHLQDATHILVLNPERLINHPLQDTELHHPFSRTALAVIDHQLRLGQRLRKYLQLVQTADKNPPLRFILSENKTG